MKLLFKILKYTFVSVIIALIIILSTFLILKFANKKSYTQIFGFSMFEVTSYSMYPKIDKGDLVIVKKRNDDYYNVGMVVTYQVDEGTTPVTHEIVNRDGNIITTRGINKETNNANDEPFDVKYIIGEVVYVYEDYSHFVSFIQNPIGLCIIVVAGILFIEIFSYFEKKYE